LSSLFFVSIGAAIFVGRGLGFLDALAAKLSSLFIDEV